MECEELTTKIYAFLDNELGSKDKKLFITHLKNCTRCSLELKHAQMFYNETNCLPSMQLSKSFVNKTVQRAKRKREVSDIGFWWQNLSWIWRSLAFASVLVGLLLGGTSNPIAMITDDGLLHKELRILFDDESVSKQYSSIVFNKFSVESREGSFHYFE